MNFLGRGLTFLFLGCLALVGDESDAVKLAAAIITLIIAITYIILWILFKFGVMPCGLPPPFLQSDSSNDSSTKTAKNDQDENEYEDDNAAPAAYADDNDAPQDTR